MAAAGVIAGRERHWVECADNLDWLRGLPDNCCSLCITSPPYEDARTYGVGFKLAGEAWVEWMAPRVVECCRVVKGLVCVNMAGKVRDHSYSPVVEWLVADLTRKHGLVCGPAPYCYFRFSIPGSGGEHYHRRDWEPVYCFARPENLPLSWSDNTAMGHAPKWAPGGEMSHRLTGGMRVNQWGKTGGHESGGQRGKGGKRQRESRPSHETVPVVEQASDGLLFEGAEPLPAEGRDEWGTPRGSGMKRANGTPRKHGAKGRKVMSREREGQHSQESTEYDPPAVANSGNVVREAYDAEAVRQLLCGGDVGGPVAQGSAGGDVVRCVVGGGSMGAKDCHDNEAPFSLRLAEFFVRSYCPPDGIVCDPFCGSSTTGHAAISFGRRYLGCDLRQSQIDLSARRLLIVNPPLFPEM